MVIINTLLRTSDATCERRSDGKHGAQEVHRQPVPLVELVCCPSHGFLPSIVSLTVIEVSMSMPVLFSPHRVGSMLEVSHIDLVFMVRHDCIGEAVAVSGQIETKKDKSTKIWENSSCHVQKTDRQTVTVINSTLKPGETDRYNSASHRQAPIIDSRDSDVSFHLSRT